MDTNGWKDKLILEFKVEKGQCCTVRYASIQGQIYRIPGLDTFKPGTRQIERQVFTCSFYTSCCC